MRASELLTAITLPTQGQAYQGLLISRESRQLPCSQIRQTDGQLIFIADNNLPPLPLTKIVIALMTHRSFILMTYAEELFLPVYGFKETADALIL